MPVRIDESAFPLVVISYVGEVSDVEFEAYLARLSVIIQRCLRDRTRYAFIFDGRQNAFATARQREMQGVWIERNFELARQATVGYAFVLNSAIARGVLTSVLWFSPLPREHLVTDKIGDALQWARVQLERDEAPA